jgi:hypothetical protein
MWMETLPDTTPYWNSFDVCESRDNNNNNINNNNNNNNIN